MASHRTHPLPGSGGSDQLHDPGAARPIGLDVLGCLLGPELPAGFTSVPRLHMRCSERDPTLSLELVADLPVKGADANWSSRDSGIANNRVPSQTNDLTSQSSGFIVNDSPSFTPVHPRIRAIGPRDLHLAKGRG